MDNLIDRYNESTRTLSGKNKPNPDNNNGTFHSPPPKQTPNHVSFSQQLPLLLMWGVGENSRVNASCDQKTISFLFLFSPPKHMKLKLHWSWLRNKAVDEEQS